MTAKGTMVLGASLLLAVAAPLTAQQQAPDQAQVQAWIAEAQQIGQRLGTLQRQVFADPAIAQERNALTARVEAAMAEADPELEQDLAGADSLEPAMAAAQQAGDAERLDRLIAEAQSLESRFIQAQQAALADPELSTIVLAFNDRVQDRMEELDPETPELIERLEQLRDRLQPPAN